MTLRDGSSEGSSPSATTPPTPAATHSANEDATASANEDATASAGERILAGPDARTPGVATGRAESVTGSNAAGTSSTAGPDAAAGAPVASGAEEGERAGARDLRDAERLDLGMELPAPVREGAVDFLPSQATNDAPATESLPRVERVPSAPERQVADAVVANVVTGPSTTTLDVAIADLGRVRVEARQEPRELDVRIGVERPETSALIHAHTSALVRELEAVHGRTHVTVASTTPEPSSSTPFGALTASGTSTGNGGSDGRAGDGARSHASSGSERGEAVTPRNGSRASARRVRVVL
ncbi:MAG: flagellar hook-length control protein FliK [Polyangiaceae bacterium]